MATVLDIVRGISQAAANAYDGSHDERYTADGEARKVGLKREEKDSVLESRDIDGFTVRFRGDKLIIMYQSDVKLQEVHENGFENDVTGMVKNIASYLKKEYKKITGDTLTLTKDGDPDILVQSVSRQRSYVCATCSYKIGNMKGTEAVEEGSSSKERLDKITKDWLSYNKNFEIGKGKNHAKNVTRKKEQSK